MQVQVSTPVGGRTGFHGYTKSPFSVVARALDRFGKGGIKKYQKQIPMYHLPAPWTIQTIRNTNERDTDEGGGK